MISQVTPGQAGKSIFSLDMLNQKTGSGTNAFDVLLSQICRTKQSSLQTSGQTSSSATGLSTVSQTSSSTNTATTVGEYKTPIGRLRQAVEATGKSADKLSLPASERGRLEEVLVKSGYEREEAKSIITKATGESGEINLGKLFRVLDKNAPEQAATILLSEADIPNLLQILREFGVGEEDIQRFVDGLKVKDGKVEVSGLDQVLQKASKEAVQVDASRISDLLQKLGLSQEETETLLAQSGDGQGKMNPKAFLALLNQAAAKNDPDMAGTLSAMAQKIKTAGTQNGAGQMADAARIRNQVLQNLNNAATDNQPKADTAAEIAKAVSNAAAEGEKALAEAAALNSSETAKEHSARAAALAAEVKSPASGGKAQADTAIDPAKAVKASSDTSASGGSTSGRAGAAASGTGGARSALPAYVVRQVSYQISQMVKGSQTSLRLQLKPAELGQLNLEISMKDGTLKATLVAESSAAKQALESGLDQLKQQLAASGIKVERLEVFVNPESARDQTANQSGEGGGRRGKGRGGGEGGGAESDAGEAETILAASDGDYQINLIL